MTVPLNCVHVVWATVCGALAGAFLMMLALFLKLKFYVDVFCTP